MSSRVVAPCAMKRPGANLRGSFLASLPNLDVVVKPVQSSSTRKLRRFDLDTESFFIGFVCFNSASRCVASERRDPTLRLNCFCSAVLPVPSDCV